MQPEGADIQGRLKSSSLFGGDVLERTPGGGSVGFSKGTLLCNGFLTDWLFYVDGVIVCMFN